MSASHTKGVGAYGHKLRRATADEQMAGTNPVDGTYVRRACGRGCVDPVDYVGTYYLEALDHRPRLYRRYACRRHAERFAKRHQLALPPPLTTDQALLPFRSIGETGETP